MASIAIAQQTTVDRLIQREQHVIEESERMLALARRTGSWNTYQWTTAIRSAKQRLAALRAGLLPIRIGGEHVELREIITVGGVVPDPIAARAEEVATRFPTAQVRVYGVDPKQTAQIRRNRDPVLTMHYGDAEFFLGFWVEIDVPDGAVPEFFGIIAPLVERHRGRPRKGVPMHELVSGG